MNVSTVLSCLSQVAPTGRALSYDNVGLLVGDPNASVKAICVSLDITKDVIDEAVKRGADLIVSHHPIIFNPLKQITPADPTGDLVCCLIKNQISAICMHTNLDAATPGVNTLLSDLVGLHDTKIVEPLGTDEKGLPYGIGLYGKLDEQKSMSDFLSHVKTVLNCPALRFYDSGRPVHTVAVGGGSCGDFVNLAPDLGVDTVVTADVKHSQFIAARTLGINLIDAGHFHTENPVTSLLSDLLTREFPALSIWIAKSNLSPVSFF